MSDDRRMTEDRRMRRNKLKKGIYILPNLFTSASLFMGFYSIIASIQEKFYPAAIAIVISLIFDGLDGRVARMTNTTSKFGAEYDSLADLVAFGLAPALLAYTWAISVDGKPGWIAGFLFVACGALRLARYNIQIGLIDSKYFNGLPIPAAACVIATTVIFFDHIGFEGAFHDPYYMILILVVALSLLMVSSIKYYSFKNMNLRSRMPFKILLIAIFIFLIFYYKPEIMAFVIMVGYALSGPIWWVFKFIQKLRHHELNNNATNLES